jgi:hypothetical protein
VIGSHGSISAADAQGTDQEKNSFSSGSGLLPYPLGTVTLRKKAVKSGIVDQLDKKQAMQVSILPGEESLLLDRLGVCWCRGLQPLPGQ